MNTIHHIRHKDFLKSWRAIERLVRRSGIGSASVPNVARIIASIPAPSYYLTYEYALRHLRNMSTRHPKRHSSRLRALRAHVDMLRHRYALSLEDALVYALESPAPSFFLSPHSASVIFYRLTSACRPRRRTSKKSQRRTHS